MSYPIERFTLANDTEYAVALLEDLGLKTFPQTLYVYNRWAVSLMTLDKVKDGMRWYVVDKQRGSIIHTAGNGKQLKGVILGTEYEQLNLFE